MKPRLLELIVCPECKQDLRIEVFEGDGGGKVIDGILKCSGCTNVYPIIDAIPRLLPAVLQRNLIIYHETFFEKYQIKPPVNMELLNSREIALQEKTLQSFSFQWNTFGEIYREYRDHWQDFLPTSFKADYFKGKLGLDAGCGFGRHIRMAAEAGAEMVGIDLSEAVRAANANTKHLNNVHIIQGDIYNPPFRPGTFDFMYSMGVLHHLPDPEGGFDSLTRLLSKGQEIFIWCYDDEKPSKNAVYEVIRRCTTKLSFRSLYFLTLIAARTINLVFNCPAILLRRIGINLKKVPYDYYNKYPARVLHADLFDVFSVPSTRYYDLDELERWFRKQKLKIFEKTHSVSGWTLHGIK
jgi:SAM-dependent methyltransferase